MVKSGKRETRVRVHAVVDFRNAPPPGAATALNQAAGAMNQIAVNPAAAAALSGQTGAAAAGSNPNDPAAALAALLKPTPGGTIIHYKVE